MDDNQNGASASAAGSSPAANTIPKERLDQEIERRREVERNLAFTQQQVQALVQQRQQVSRPSAPDPELEKLRQEHPAMAERYIRQQHELKQVRAGVFSTFDRQDRLEFIQEFGTEGKKRVQEVERILEMERQKGNHNASRAGIYVWMRGQERLQNDAKVLAQGGQQRETQNFSDGGGAPGSDPDQATTVRAGTAGRDMSKLSFEEREKLLENEEF